MRTTLLLFALFLFSFHSYASHLLGGDITAQHIGGSNYAVTLTVYCDTLATPMATTTNINVSDSAGNSAMHFNIDCDKKNFGRTQPGCADGIRSYIYHGYITLPEFGKYSISWSYHLGNAVDISLTKPDNENLLLTTIINYDSLSNSTPVFLAPPVFIISLNSPWTYNPLPFDIDGDSLHCSAFAPSDSDTLQTTAQSLPATRTGPFKIDPLTGMISWTPATTGTFSTVVIVEEYRHGAKTSEIRRKLQMIVVDNSATTPGITNFKNISLNNEGYPCIELNAEQDYNLTLYAKDPDPLQSVNVTSFGEPYLFAQDDASFSTTTNSRSKNSLTINFNWKPCTAMARDKAYPVLFRVTNGDFACDYTVLFKVTKPKAVADNNYFSIGNIYPNPAASLIFLSLSLEKETKISVHISDILGNPVWYSDDVTFDKGKHVFSEAINLQNGQYIAQILKDDAIYKTQKILIVK